MTDIFVLTEARLRGYGAAISKSFVGGASAGEPLCDAPRDLIVVS